MEKTYAIDPSNAEMECLEPHVPLPNRRGRPRGHTTREILNAVYFLLGGGHP